MEIPAEYLRYHKSETRPTRTGSRRTYISFPPSPSASTTISTRTTRLTCNSPGHTNRPVLWRRSRYSRSRRRSGPCGGIGNCRSVYEFFAALGFTHVFSPTFFSETIVSGNWAAQPVTSTGDPKKAYEPSWDCRVPWVKPACRPLAAPSRPITAICSTMASMTISGLATRT